MIENEKDLKKLSRADLLELLIAQIKENEHLTVLLSAANEKLDSRQIILDDAGSIAEAALRLSGIFETAQTAADQYLENIRVITQQREAAFARQKEDCIRDCERLVQEAEAKCQRMKEETRLTCDSVLMSVKEDLENYYEQARKKVDLFNTGAEPVAQSPAADEDKCDG